VSAVPPLGQLKPQCAGQESNLQGSRGCFTGTWAHQCPADAGVQYRGWESNPQTNHQGLSLVALPVCVPRRWLKTWDAQGGTRTHNRAGLSRAARPVGVPGHGSFKLRGYESNVRPPGSEPGVATSSYCPGILVNDTLRYPRFGEKGSNLHRLIQSQAAYR
jgi:hypothetical protein